MSTALGNLRDVAADEEKWSDIYRAFSKVAIEQCFNEVVAAFDSISIAVKQHGKRYKELNDKFEAENFFK